MNALAKIIVWLLMKVHCAVGLIFSNIISYHITSTKSSSATQMYDFCIFILLQP